MHAGDLPVCSHATRWLRRVGIVSSLAGLVLSSLAPMRASSAPDIDLTLASRYLDEARALCEADNGRLWGVTLCGPLLFADPRTRAVAANLSDREGRLTSEGGVFVGTLPPNVTISYTSLEWAGIRWTMLIWPLPADKYERGRLYAHESWHRIQKEIGFPMSGPPNAHLDTLEGRIWMRLEWRALQRALTHEGPARRRAILDALAFRLVRRSLFANAATEERTLEMHEGLAEYTGVKLSGHPNLRAFAVKLLEQGEANKTFVRSFAYASGPAYGLLLDDARPNWRTGLKPSDDFGRLLVPSFYLKRALPSKKRAEQITLRYGGRALRASESERDSVRRKQEAEMRARFVDGPVLRIPLRQMRMQFDPNQVQPLEGHGTVYPEIRIADVWGILTASKGALISSGFDYVVVTAPADVKLPAGDGWALELNEGWSIEPAERSGDYLLKKRD